MFWLLMFAVAAVVGLLMLFFRIEASKRLQKFSDGRRATSRIVSRGEFVDGNRRLTVALALTDSAFYYENSDMQASLDLEWIEDIEYDTELSTGRSTINGKVLRLRCHRQVFEFILSNDVVLAWKTVMPPRRAKADAGAAIAPRFVPDPA